MIYVIGLDGTVRGVISNDIPEGAKYWDDLHTRAIKDGLSVFEFKCSAGFEATGAIEVEHYVADVTDDDRLVLFKVKEIQTIHGADGLYKQVFAESVSLELLKTIVRPNPFTGVSAEPILDYILDGTPWQRGIVDATGLASIDFNDYPTAVESINKIAEEVGGEVEYRITLTDGRISGRYVDIVERLGQYTGKRFEYGKDVLEIIKTEDNSEIFTAVVPIGTNDEDGNPATVTSLSQTFTKRNGTVIYKNAGEDFIADPEALARWSADGQHLTAVLKVDDYAPNTVLRKGWEFLIRHNEPKLQYELSVALLAKLVPGYGHEDVQIGDTVTIVDYDFEEPLALEARIVEMGISKTNPADSYVKFANFVELDIQAEDRIADLMEKIRQNESAWIKNTEGETMYKSPTPPDNPVLDTLWLDTSGNFEILKRWDGTVWRAAAPTSADQIGAETPTGAQTKADEARTAALVYADNLKTQTDADINDVVTDLTSLETEVNGAFRDGVIEEAEAVAIEKYINSLTAQKEEVAERFGTIHGNPDLDGAAKTNVASAKDAYDTAHINLVGAIDTAIADGRTTAAEKADVDAKFTAYRVALATLSQRFEEAIDATMKKQIVDIEIGGKNLLDNTESEWSTPFAASGGAYSKYRDGLNALFQPLVGRNVMLSFDVKIDASDNLPHTIRVYGLNGSPKYAFSTVNFTAETDWTRVELPISIYENVGDVGEGRVEFWGVVDEVTKIYVRELKLENGTKATPWTPSPADVKLAAELYADNLKTQTDADIAAVAGDLTALETEIDTTFKDGVIEEAEALAIEKYKNTLNAQKLEIDKRYDTIYANGGLSGTPKTNLSSAKSALNTSHTNLLNAIDSAIADSKTTAAEKADVDSKFTAYRTSLTTIAQRFEEAIDAIAKAKADAAEQSAKGYADTLKNAIDADIAAVSSDLTNFETEVNGAFKDGIIEEAEAVAIEKYKNELNAEKVAIDNRKNAIYAIPELSGAEKTTLDTAKGAFNTAHANLISAIESAIADGKTTAAEKADVDSKFTAYRDALATLHTRLEEAVDAIATVKADSAEQGAKDYADTQDGTTLTSANQFTQSYAQKSITQSTAAPSSPSTGDLWIDINPTPHVWKRWNGSAWKNAVPTNLSELAGKITETQITDDAIRTQHIAANSIVSSMIATLGLDAGVIKFGTMSGASILLGGVNDENGVLIVHSSDGEPIAELNGDVGGFPFLSVGYLEAQNKVEYGDFTHAPLTYHVAPNQFSSYPAPSDENGGTGWSDSLRTIQEAIDRIPKVFDGDVKILLAYGQTFYEDIDISGFSGNGKLVIERSAETTRPKLQGSVRMTNNTIRIEWRNVNLDATDDYAGFFIQNSCGLMADVSINGVSGNTSYGVNVNTGGSFEFYRVYVANVGVGFRASYGGYAYVNNGTGSCATYGIQGFGGFVMGSGTAPTGGTANNATSQGGQVTGTWSYPTPPAAPAPVTETVITKWTANSDSGTWRTDYNAWDVYASANQVTQGSYSGYGDFKGSWFFGTGVASTLTGKTIRRIRIYMKRDSGGTSASVTARIRPHTSSSRPGGNVSIQSPSHNVGFSVGTGKWVTLPTSFHAGFASGSYKGLSVDGSAYMKFGKSAVIEVTYET